MAKLTNVNVVKSGTGLDWAGKFLFLLKEIAVSAGWTVKGSGDGGTRFGYSGVTAALAGAQQGSGGDFDCWITGTGTAHTSGLQAGDPRHGSWIVLENDGRELLIAPSAQTAASWDGYCRILYARRGAGGFDGSVASATEIPGAATGEAEIAGTRASSDGDSVFLYADSGYVNLWADDAAELGALALGFMTVSSTTPAKHWMCVAPVIAATSQGLTVDPDPAGVFYAANGPFLGSGQGYAWNYGSGAMEAIDLGGRGDSFWGGNGAPDPTAAKDPYTNVPLIIGVGLNEIVKGLVSPKAFAWTAALRTHPDIGVDDSANVFCYFGQTGGFIFPWVAAGTAPLP